MRRLYASTFDGVFNMIADVLKTVDSINKKLDFALEDNKSLLDQDNAVLEEDDQKPLNSGNKSRLDSLEQRVIDLEKMMVGLDHLRR